MVRVPHSLLTCAILTALSFTTCKAIALPQTTESQSSPQQERGSVVVDDKQQRLTKAYERLLDQQLKQNLSIVRSVRVLVNNYPEHINPILNAAFNKEPRHYSHIIRAAILTEPALTQDIVITSIARDMDSPANIVRIAIKAEPGYIDDIVRAASLIAPYELDSIVQAAVESDPEMTQQVLMSANDTSPGKLAQFMDSALNALPALGDYLLSTMQSIIPYLDKDVSPEEQELMQREKTKDILRGALQAGMTKEEIESAATAAGLNTQDLDSVALELHNAPPN
ncbi:hypothetical protein SAMN06297229_2330 [Pseudidiomarina planktonica]|uniref:Uncharacterized protein n=1 Tax=Pseudidiomarina planktonica TaxID=1323738 RepID=A0A1Y6FYD1_9GAMM|nr:hypothetical protein [Pseudidiomarina planktonica]RUO62827.1 hypothetical protein CWI77_11585 [Pseudidiomarina planktonica]SMQ80707.1 hypothetical protein SAMN06297229_2330 [Pseudidiomarina planktonica]